MKILLTGSTGYIGKRLLPILVGKGYQVICAARDVKRINIPYSLLPKVAVIQLDLTKKETLQNIPKDIDAAYYLVHSMALSDDYDKLELHSAINFREALNNTNVKHVIYLSALYNEEDITSKHLSSRKIVGDEIAKGKYHLTILRAGIIIGSGSASFEIIRDLVEKLPIMVAPRWVKTLSQPIAIADVLGYLSEVLFDKRTYDNTYDIGGPDILSYKEMLLQLAQFRSLKRIIVTIPVLTPKLSSYWLYFITSTSFKLAKSLVSSMKTKVVCKDNSIKEIIKVENLSYRDAIERAFRKIENEHILSSWKDSFVSGNLSVNVSELIDIPSYGCFKDVRVTSIKNKIKSIEKIWKIGGSKGWYYANFLWEIRGFVDKLFGGVGLNRGRTNKGDVSIGDAIDFWRVLHADKQQGRLLLFSEMKLPGEAWLEFKIIDNKLYQTAIFRPRGLGGRLYWYILYPFHSLIFSGLINKLS